MIRDLHLEMHLPRWHTYRPKNLTKLSKWWYVVVAPFDDMPLCFILCFLIRKNSKL